MTDPIYQHLALPESCFLGKRIFKNLFLKNAQLGAADKKAFDQDVDTIFWQYTLKPATVPIPPCRDDQREYLEVAVLQTNLQHVTRHQRIAEAIHRAIPYPLLLVLACDSRVAISVANKRFSQAETSKIVAEELFSTEWLNPDSATAVAKDFLNSLEFKTLPQSNFHTLYCGYIERIIAHQCARFCGQYKLGAPGTDWRIRHNRLADCRRIKQNIAELRQKLKIETQFNRQVELNMRIKGLEKKLNKTELYL
ncbi:MAG: DUF4391 domain-containing protein [Phycisphaerales bacterium]|nr:DUF4391 domain-containing protein [Phycisphaerales bacterium]